MFAVYSANKAVKLEFNSEKVNDKVKITISFVSYPEVEEEHVQCFKHTSNIQAQKALTVQHLLQQIQANNTFDNVKKYNENVYVWMQNVLHILETQGHVAAKEADAYKTFVEQMTTSSSSGSRYIEFSV